MTGNAQSDDAALKRLEQTLRAAAAGDFGVRLPARRKDATGTLERAYNELAARNAAARGGARPGRVPSGPQARADAVKAVNNFHAGP